MPLLIPHPILHPTRSSRTPCDIHTLAGAVVSAESEGSQNQPRSLARAIGLTWLFLFMTMQPNKAFADQPNFDSHSNQDALDFSDHRQTKKKRPPPPGEPTPPPPPGGRRQAGQSKSPASLLLLAHQLGPSDHTAAPDFGATSGFHFAKPFPSAPHKNVGASGVIPTPSSLFLLVLAAHHRRRRMTYGVRPNHGCFHHHLVRSPPGANDQSGGVT